MYTSNETFSGFIAKNIDNILLKILLPMYLGYIQDL